MPQPDTIARSGVWPERLREALRAGAAGEIAPNVMLAQIAAITPDREQAEHALRCTINWLELRRDSAGTARVRAALDLLRQAADTYRVIASMLFDHDRADGAADTIAHWAGVFDRAVAACPEASVALYSLGRADLLAAATAELVDWLRARGLLDRRPRVLDLGCGIGRLLRSLAPDVESVVGVDVSPAMTEVARARCADVANAAVVRTSGRGLPFRRGAFDLVCAVDVFPYLVRVAELAERQAEAIADALAPGGALVVINYSYRGDLARDRADIARLAQRCGFGVAENGSRPFALWDGVAFVLSK